MIPISKLLLVSQNVTRSGRTVRPPRRHQEGGDVREYHHGFMGLGL